MEKAAVDLSGGLVDSSLEYVLAKENSFPILRTSVVDLSGSRGQYIFFSGRASVFSEISLFQIFSFCCCMHRDRR